MTEIKSVKFPLHQNKARVYDAAGKYLFWISLAGEINALDELRERGEGWLDFRNRTQPMRDALEVEELSIAKHFVDAINAFESNEAALAAKDAEIERLREALQYVVDWYGERDNHEKLYPANQQADEIRLAMLALAGGSDPHAAAKEYLAGKPDREPSQIDIDDDLNCGGFV